MTRNWSAVLIDAGLRKLSPTQVAKELGICRGQVSAACKRYGVRLPTSEGKHDRNRAKGAATNAAYIKRKWDRRFAASKAGVTTINDFCSRFACSQGAALKHASERGFRFKRTSNARSPR
jgi:hypothetical protein